eukprot:jgi/Bigna1/91585/estExt_fgenesh1_pg.C_1080001
MLHPRTGTRSYSPCLLWGLLAPAICVVLLGFQDPKTNIAFGPRKKRDPEPTISVAKPVKVGELIAQSSGVAIGALLIKRGYKMLRERIPMGHPLGIPKAVVGEGEPLDQIPSKTGMEELGYDLGQLYQTESMLWNRDITANFTMLGSGFDSTGCCGAMMNIQVIGKRSTLLRSEEESAQPTANLGELFTSGDPVVIAIQVMKPMSRRYLISRLKRGLIAWIEKDDRAEVYKMLRELRSRLKETLPSPIMAGSTLRFDMLPSGKQKSNDTAAGEVSEPVVEIILGSKSLLMMQSRVFMKQLLNMIVGPRPLSPSVKDSIGETAVEVLKLALANASMEEQTEPETIEESVNAEKEPESAPQEPSSTSN